MDAGNGRVAPPAGAWIETHNTPLSTNICSRAPRGRVDRNFLDEKVSTALFSRAPRGRVDRNWITQKLPNIINVAPPAGAWIETNLAPASRERTEAVAPPRGRVDRNWRSGLLPTQRIFVAPLVGVWVETRW